MATQRCPRCRSARTRRGYRPTHIWKKILLRYNLLCDNCNWEFEGFGIPGTIRSRPTRSDRVMKNIAMEKAEDLEVDESESDLHENTGNFKRKRIRIKS